MNSRGLSRLPAAVLTIGLLVGIVQAQQFSRTCQFNNGPRTGKIIMFYAAKPVPVGSSCTDGVSSAGVAVPDNPIPNSRTRASSIKAHDPGRRRPIRR